jgi:putative transposase
MAMVEIVFSRNCVYQFAYHVVWCPKYRHQILIGPIALAVGDMADQICKENKWTVIAKEIQPDHIHLFLTIPPAISIASAIKILKWTTACKLFVRFPELKRKLWEGHLWSPSYYAGTAGNVSADTIKKYIERVEHIGGRR